MDTAKGTFIISHSSALELFRHPGFRWYLEQGRRDVPAGVRWNVSASRVIGARDADGLIGRLTLPLHVTSCGDFRGRNSGLRVIHRHRGILPPSSLVALGKGLFVSSPELCMVQLASELTPVDLAVLVMELCGSYRMGQSGTLYGEPLLTDIATLQGFIQSCRDAKRMNLHGVKRLDAVLGHIAAGSASPRETAVCLLLCLPTVWGGYGLPWPQVNYPLPVHASHLETLGRKSYRFDLCWPESKVALEYDSSEFHSDAVRLALDAEKRTTAQKLGYTVVSLTNGQLRNVDAMDELAAFLSAKLGRRFRIRAKGFALKQHVLRATLLDPASA